MLRSCPKCQHHFYQIMDHTMVNSGGNEHFVVCSSCGAVLGIFKENDIGYEKE